MSAKQFALDIDEEFRKAVEEPLLRTVISVAMELEERVKTKTPVDTGNARASWTGSVGSPDFLPQSKGGVASGGSMAAVAAMTKPDIVYITNSAVYASQLENGSSKQAPQGMVALSIAEIEAKYGR